VAVDGEDEELALHGVVGLHAYERREALVVPVAVVPREVGTGKSYTECAAHFLTLRLLGVGHSRVRHAEDLHVVVDLVNGDRPRGGVAQVDSFDDEGLQRDNPQVFVPLG
jgi:hypothetical protein